MARAPRLQTRINTLLAEDAALPLEQRMPHEDRLRYYELLAKLGKMNQHKKGVKWGNNLTSVRKKPARTERSLSPEAEARIKAIGASKPIAPPKAETLSEFLKDENAPGT